MKKSRRKPSKATHARVHERAYRNFRKMSREEREELLVQFGILTKEKRLSPRYGGPRRRAPANEMSSGSR